MEMTRLCVATRPDPPPSVFPPASAAASSPTSGPKRSGGSGTANPVRGHRSNLWRRDVCLARRDSGLLIAWRLQEFGGPSRARHECLRHESARARTVQLAPIGRAPRHAAGLLEAWPREDQSARLIVPRQAAAPHEHGIFSTSLANR